MTRAVALSDEPFDMQKAYDTELDHLIRMASIPAFKAHAWHRAKQLDTEPGFTGIANALVERMNAISR